MIPSLLPCSGEKKKKKKQKSASFIFSVLCPQANFSLVLEQRRGMSYFALITPVSARLCFRSVVGNGDEMRDEGKERRLAKSEQRRERGKQVYVKISLFV